MGGVHLGPLMVSTPPSNQGDAMDEIPDAGQPPPKKRGLVGRPAEAFEDHTAEAIAAMRESGKRAAAEAVKREMGVLFRVLGIQPGNAAPGEPPSP